MAQRHNPTLDGIRGLAILAVLLEHAIIFFPETFASRLLIRPMAFGWSGVDLFFVLSGFLITGILLDSKGATNRAQSFYARRFFRIFPIYYFALAVVFGIAMICPKLAWISASNGWPDRLLFFAYLQNWLVLKHPLHGAVGHFWSLAVEEQFYLIWPWLVWMLPSKNVLRLSVIGAACAFVLRVLLVAHFGAHFWINALTITRGEGLLVGSALAVIAAARGRIPAQLLVGMGALGASILAAIAMLDHREFANTDAGPYMYTIGISGIGLVCGALVGSSSYSIAGLTPFLNLKWLKGFGKYSYGLYVYHIPVYIGIESLLGRFGFNSPLPLGYAVPFTAFLIALSFGIAWLSYVLFESKLLRLKRHFEPVYRSVDRGSALALEEPRNTRARGQKELVASLPVF